MLEMHFLFNFKVLNYVYTPFFASGKFVGELIFAIEPTGKNKFLMRNWQIPKILKRSHKVGEKMYPPLRIGVGQGNSILGPE